MAPTQLEMYFATPHFSSCLLFRVLCRWLLGLRWKRKKKEEKKKVPLMVNVFRRRANSL